MCSCLSFSSVIVFDCVSARMVGPVTLLCPSPWQQRAAARTFEVRARRSSAPANQCSATMHAAMPVGDWRRIRPLASTTRLQAAVDHCERDDERCAAPRRDQRQQRRVASRARGHRHRRQILTSWEKEKKSRKKHGDELTTPLLSLRCPLSAAAPRRRPGTQSAVE